MKPNKVSILIPTYNQAHFITDAVISALSQDYKNKEIIISDDNSTDKTFEVVKNKYSNLKSVKLYRNQDNIGRVGNYRKLLNEYAKGDWVINLDGDDFFTNKSYISAAMDCIETNQVIAVFGNQTVFDQSTNEQYIESNQDLSEIIDGNAFFLDFPGKNIRLPHLSTLYNRDYARRIGFYSQDITSSDWESLLRLVIGNKIAYLNIVAGTWRIHGANESKSININSLAKNLNLVQSVMDYAQKTSAFSYEQLKTWEIQMYKKLTKMGLSKLFRQKKYINACNLLSATRNHSRKAFYGILFDYKTIIEAVLSLNASLYTTAFRFLKK